MLGRELIVRGDRHVGSRSRAVGAVFDGLKQRLQVVIRADSGGQAEHGPTSPAVLVTTSAELSRQVEREVARQLDPDLVTGETAGGSARRRAPRSKAPPMATDDGIEGRHALVTGAGRGLGRATALALA